MVELKVVGGAGAGAVDIDFKLSIGHGGLWELRPMARPGVSTGAYRSQKRSKNRGCLSFFEKKLIRQCESAALVLGQTVATLEAKDEALLKLQVASTGSPVDGRLR